MTSYHTYYERTPGSGTGDTDIRRKIYHKGQLVSEVSWTERYSTFYPPEEPDLPYGVTEDNSTVHVVYSANGSQNFKDVVVTHDWEALVKVLKTHKEYPKRRRCAKHKQFLCTAPTCS